MMEMSQANELDDRSTEYSDSSADSRNKNEAWIVGDSLTNDENETGRSLSVSSETSFYAEGFRDRQSDLNCLSEEVSSNNNILAEPIYLSSLDTERMNEEFNRRINESDMFIKSEENFKSIFNTSAVIISHEILELNLSIKKEAGNFDCGWSIEEKSDKLASESEKISKRSDTKRNVILVKNKRSGVAQRLRKEAESMRERRKKLYENEKVEERLSRLAKQAARRRELRAYSETPEKRRKRLDDEAARKREYRMNSETPDERRKRLDQEAERRRLKRLKMYANETLEERRERLNRESAKRRESRLNQYAKETEKERRLRLEKDAMRAREMRFTRSTIESDEERRERLLKDALRKRELRMHGNSERTKNFSELQTGSDLDEFQSNESRENPQANKNGMHYSNNWMLWLQNSISLSTGNLDTSQETDILQK